MKSYLGCFLLVILFNLILGGIAVQYCIEHWLHRGIAFGWAALIGILAGEVAVPAAFVTWLLVLAGVLA